MKKRVCVIGHFAYGKNLLNGQTIKTKIITNELYRQFGENEVRTIDTYGGEKNIPRLLIEVGMAMKDCSNLIMLPANNGVRFFSPLFVFWKKIFHSSIHYIVIGGWLPLLLEKKHILKKQLKQFDGIYVETKTMKEKLQSQGFENVYVVPNCKNISVVKAEDIRHEFTEPFPLCTFSRVMKEKGIEEAMLAVMAVNNFFRRNIVTLDIYGEVDCKQEKWFQSLKDKFPDFVFYRGKVPFDRTTEILKNYYALLFPTYYEGEGVAGTLIDAMAAGVPVIASNWKYNSEIIINNVTGVMYDLTEDGDLINKIIYSINNKEKWISMKCLCVEHSKRYLPDIALKDLIRNL